MTNRSISRRPPLRVGIIGAGLNADYHISFAKAYPAADVVGIADADLSRAADRGRKYGIQAFGSTRDLVRVACPEVVHIVTPPRTHAAVVSEVLEARRHVLVEKPLAINGPEAEALYGQAESAGVLLCPMHNHLFDPCMQRAKEVIKSGALGRVINVESYYGLNTMIPAFRDYPQPNVLPWLYALPGGVYQDFLPHPLYVLLEYTGGPRKLTVMSRAMGALPQNLPDEIRILVDGEHAFGTATVSFAAKPHLHFLRIYGTRMMLEVDFNHMTTITHRVSSMPKAAEKATYNLDESWQRATSTISNMFQFVTGTLKPYHGMMTLIHGFYDAVRNGAPVPVSKDHALSVVKTMDTVFEQLSYTRLNHERIVPLASGRDRRQRVLVTGGTGFVGKRLVRRLIEDGYAVRVLARKLANVTAVEALGAEIFWGDVADITSFDEAIAGCEYVIHLAAGTSGTERDSRTATLQGTRNLLELCDRHKPTRVIYISSCSVYGVADYKANALVSESAPLERFPERRGNYSASKQEAESYVTSFMKASDVPTVILRPGTIYGPGGDLYTPMMGFSAGRVYIVIGSGSFVLPFVYVDNVVDAIAKALTSRQAVNEIFNVVDVDPLTKRAYMNAVIRRVQRKAKVFYLPYAALYVVTWMQEIACRLMKRTPFLTRYRLTSSQKNVVYDASKITSRLGWTPPVSQHDALEQLVRAEMIKQHGETWVSAKADTYQAA